MTDVVTQSHCHTVTLSHSWLVFSFLTNYNHPDLPITSAAFSPQFPPNLSSGLKWMMRPGGARGVRVNEDDSDQFLNVDRSEFSVE